MKSGRGGYRPGAGRKPKAPTKTYRLPLDWDGQVQHFGELQTWVRECISVAEAGTSPRYDYLKRMIAKLPEPFNPEGLEPMNPEEFNAQVSQILAIQRQLQEDQIRFQAELAEVKATSENNVRAIVELRATVADLRSTVTDLRSTVADLGNKIERMILLIGMQQDNQEGLQARLKLLEERVNRMESP